MNFATTEVECGNRSQSSLTSYYEHVLQVELG